MMMWVRLLLIKHLIYFGKINTQKLIGSGYPVRIIMLTLGTLFVNELIYWFIFWGFQNIDFSYLKKTFLSAGEPRLEICLDVMSSCPDWYGGASSPA